MIATIAAAAATQLQTNTLSYQDDDDDDDDDEWQKLLQHPRLCIVFCSGFILQDQLKCDM